MKAKQRHELHTNALAEWLSETGENLKPYSAMITAGLIVAAIALGAYFYIQGASQRGAAAASEQLLTAMDMRNQGLAELVNTIKDYPGTSQAAMAELLLAESFLDNGAYTIFRNKPAGRENISKAMATFDEVEKKTRDPMLRAWAIFGLGRSQESLGDIGQAHLAYDQLVKEYPDSAVAESARQHLNRLSQPGTKEFYEWFATQNPQPPAANTEPGAPGLKPSFDIKEPASPGDVKLPSALGPNASGTQPAATAPSAAPPSTTPPAGAPSTPTPPAAGNKPPAASK